MESVLLESHRTCASRWNCPKSEQDSKRPRYKERNANRRLWGGRSALIPHDDFHEERAHHVQDESVYDMVWDSLSKEHAKGPHRAFCHHWRTDAWYSVE